jgi:hypothetical protein
MAIIAFLVVIFFLLHVAFNAGTGRPFNKRDMEAFEKVKAVRERLDDVKNIVAPAPPKPDYNLTLGFSAPKPSPEPAPKPEAAAAAPRPVESK